MAANLADARLTYERDLPILESKSLKLSAR